MIYIKSYSHALSKCQKSTGVQVLYAQSSVFLNTLYHNLVRAPKGIISIFSIINSFNQFWCSQLLMWLTVSVKFQYNNRFGHLVHLICAVLCAKHTACFIFSNPHYGWSQNSSLSCRCGLRNFLSRSPEPNTRGRTQRKFKAIN